MKNVNPVPNGVTWNGGRKRVSVSLPIVRRRTRRRFPGGRSARPRLVCRSRSVSPRARTRPDGGDGSVARPWPHIPCHHPWVAPKSRQERWGAVGSHLKGRDAAQVPGASPVSLRENRCCTGNRMVLRRWRPVRRKQHPHSRRRHAPKAGLRFGEIGWAGRRKRTPHGVFRIADTEHARTRSHLDTECRHIADHKSHCFAHKVFACCMTV